MTEPLLVVDTDHTVYLNGRKLALASPVRIQAINEWDRTHARLAVHFDCVEIPEITTPPKPKRTWSSAMGLKKPKGS